MATNSPAAGTLSGSTPPRKSHHIRSRAASRFFKGAKHAREHGRPFTLMVTINFTFTTCSKNNVVAAANVLRAKFTRWLNYQSKKALTRGEAGYGPPTYGAVQEAPHDKDHVHWLVHVPLELDALFKKTLPTWVAKVCGVVRDPDRAVRVDQIHTVMALARYLMKGIDPHHAARYYVRPHSQGLVIGKRVAISRSLGPTARRKEVAAFERAAQLMVTRGTV